MKGLRLRRREPRTAPPPLVLRWDLDKTYLRSDFDSLRQLVRTAFERAEDKVDVPGVAELIKALKDSAARAGRPARVYFLSASPPQIGKAIRAKLALDGVPYDGIVFKNQLQQIRRGRFRNLREHVGFKLGELLRGRLEAPPEAHELLFGDDWESDPLIYSLYADVLAGRLATSRLTPILERIGVERGLVERVGALAARAARHDAVDRIFINLERRTPPAVFQLFGPRVVPTFNYFQTAAVLAAAGFLTAPDVARVGRALGSAGFTPRRLANSLDDLVRRGRLAADDAAVLAAQLAAEGVLDAAGPSAGWRRALGALGRLGRQRPIGARPGAAPSRPAAALDYDAILDRLRPGTRASAGPERREAP